MVEVSTLKDLEKWHKNQPVDCLKIIAVRVISRVLFSLTYRRNATLLTSLNDEEILFLGFRTIHISENIIFHPEKFNELKEYSYAAYYSIVSQRHVSGIEKRFTIPAANIAYLSSLTEIDDGHGQLTSIINDALEVVKTQLGLEGRYTYGADISPVNLSDKVLVKQDWTQFLFKELNVDINLLSNGMKPSILAHEPLFKKNDIFNNPNYNKYIYARRKLLAGHENWQFWIDWYQAKLDGTLHSGLTQSQQEDLYYKIATFPNELWEDGAEAVNQRIAELLEEIREEAQSATNDVVKTIIAPDELDGAHLELSDGKFELAKSSSPLSKAFDKESQEILQKRLQSRINMLSEQVSRVSNQYPQLDIVIKEYQTQLENDLEQLNSAEFWGHSVALMAQAKAYLTQNNSGTMSPALEPNLCALLEEVSQLNGGFVLGFPRGKELSARANEAQLPEGFDQPSRELIKLLIDQKEIIGDKLGHLLTSISEAVDAGGWKYARLEYSTVSTLHNLLLSIGKTVIKFDQAILKSGTGVTVYALVIAQKFPEINPATIQIVWDLLLGHPSLIAQFTAPFPELHKWMEYVIKRAEVLKIDNEINNKEK